MKHHPNWNHRLSRIGFTPLILLLILIPTACKAQTDIPIAENLDQLLETINTELIADLKSEVQALKLEQRQSAGRDVNNPWPQTISNIVTWVIVGYFLLRRRIPVLAEKVEGQKK